MTQPVTGVHLWLLLWKAAKAQEARARRSIDTTGLCLSDFAALEALLHKGPMAVNALGRKVLISSGSITTAVDRLEREGLVERRDSPTDRRSCIAHLTPKGETLIRKLFKLHARDMEEGFEGLDPEERETLVTLLRKVGAGAEGAAPTE